MSVTQLKVQLQDTTIGQFTPNEGVAALVYGLEVSSGTLSGKPILLTSNDQYTAWATAAQGDAEIVNNDAHLAAIIAKFYQKAGSGAYLWLMLVSGKNDDFVTSNAVAIKSMVYQTAANGFGYRPRLIGFASQAVDTISSAPMPATLPTMVTSIETMQNELFAESFRVCNVVATSISTTNLSTSGALDPSKAINFATYNAPSVAVLITTSLGNPTLDAQGNITAYVPLKDVGEVLGVMASISIAQSIGSCGVPSVASQAFFNDQTNVVDISTVSLAMFNAMGKAQNLFHRTRRQLTGVFYNDGATCNDATMALSKLEYLRLGNAVCDDAEYYFQRIINTQQPVDASGNLSATASALFENGFYNQFAQPRISAGQCSNITVQVDGTNFVSTKTLKVSISIQPSPSVEQVFVYTFYVTSQA